MRRLLLDTVLALPKFPGHGRLFRLVRNCCYRPYERMLKQSFRMELDVYEWTQLALAGGEFTEPETVKLIQRLLAPGDVFVDVGAHVGTMGLVARQCVGPSGKIVAIEPQPYNCQRILRNWEINGFENLKLFVAAAGPACGAVSLPQQSITDKARLSLALAMPNALALKYTVPMITLEAALDSEPNPIVKLLKIDVEGFELDVLRGLGRIADRVQNMILEVLDDEAPQTHGSEHGIRVRPLLDWLSAHGYELYTVSGDRWNGQLPLIESNLWAQKISGDRPHYVAEN